MVAVGGGEHRTMSRGIAIVRPPNDSHPAPSRGVPTLGSSAGIRHGSTRALPMVRSSLLYSNVCL